MSERARYPSAAWTTPLVILIAVAWSVLRVAVSREDFFPITFVIPLLVCVWTRRRWQLWGMAAAFVANLFFKILWLLPPEALADRSIQLSFLASLLNVVVGAAVVHALLRMRDRHDRNCDRILLQNAELEARAEELTLQNEEIKAQAEELIQQNEEIESQAEEFERQNQELQEANERLANREEVLQAAVESARQAGGAREALQNVCTRMLAIFGAPADAVALLEVVQGRLRCCVQSTVEGEPALPEDWPLEGSLAQVVLQKGQTAYVDDLQRRPDLSAPFDTGGRYRSALVTPVHLRGNAMGVLVACSRAPSHWSQEHFRIIEWAAAQAGPVLESLRWQDELQQRAASVEAANRAKDEFLAMLSHELRTPLTPVLAAASELEHDARLPEDVRGELAMIQRNVAVQSRLIDDLLDLTRIGRGKMDLNQQVILLAPLLREAAAIVAAELDANAQMLELDLQVNGNCTVFGDGARLQQVFWNLLKNALKFSPRGSKVQLSAMVRPGHPRHANQGGQRVVVRVKDEGVGIDRADLERIFQPFEQAAAARRRGGNGGLGLGLSIARAIVELHDGALTASSEGAGRGSTFVVELPMSDQPMPAPGRAPVPEARTHTGTNQVPLKILLIEDHGDTGMVMARLLRRFGYDVVHAQSCAEAMAAWENHPFDLVVSDLGLPDGSGLDLMREIRRRRPGVPGICMSGFGMESDVEASRAAGFTEHLIKPVDMQQLHAAIRRMLAARAEP